MAIGAGSITSASIQTIASRALAVRSWPPPRIGCVAAASRSFSSWSGRTTRRFTPSTSRSVITTSSARPLPNGSTAARRHPDHPRRSSMSISDRIRIKDVRVLSDSYGTLKTTTLEWRRANGEWQTQHRETYDRGGAATILPYNLSRRTVVLVRQFRYAAYVA